MLNRLDATGNNLDAAAKKSESHDASIQETEAEISDIRASVLEVKETIHSIFAEQMSSTGVVPDSLEEAEDPTYEVGSQAIIEANHMPGMYGAEATIAGAFDTVAYSVTYNPTTGGDPVENHKWVIHEELEDSGEAPLEPGTEVTLDAEHMKGMDGATAEIESAVETTVYMIDFTTTTGGDPVENHKWVIERELSPVE
ncbi:YdhK family protein [Salimicrobium humidisoli]